MEIYREINFTIYFHANLSYNLLGEISNKLTY